MQKTFDPEYYRGRRVLVTGHTGFKGAWLCRILQLLGAEVWGFAKEPPTDPALYTLAHIGEQMHAVTGDICDIDAFSTTLRAAQPEVLFHLAAQPIVREGYRDPRGTFAANLMGTVNVLEAARACDSLRSVLIVTTDKVYQNGENAGALRENDALGGADPYSASKACAELAVHSYRVLLGALPISTARAGNVIGGGDFAPDRILPDCVRAFLSGSPLQLRNPRAVRPYQHVLEALFAYLMIAARQAEEPALQGCYNVGPAPEDAATTEALVALFGEALGAPIAIQADAANGPREAACLRLCCDELTQKFAWHPTWPLRVAVEKTAAWTRALADGKDVRAVMDAQITEFIKA